MNKDIIKIEGNKTHLMPATLNDRQNVYEWCFHSETTKYHSGPPNYPNNPIPTYEDFCASDEHGYTDYYFTGAKPKDGRGFIIVNDEEPIGFVSYCSFHLKPNTAELDIWIKDDTNCGKGFGTDALVALSNWLNKEMGIDELIMGPPAKNIRAVKAYEKAGFKITDTPMGEFLKDEYVSILGSGDYGVDETLILVKHYN